MDIRALATHSKKAPGPRQVIADIRSARLTASRMCEAEVGEAPGLPPTRRTFIRMRVRSGFPICDEFYCHKFSYFCCRAGSSDPGCTRGAVYSASKNGRDPRAVIRLGAATQHGLHRLLTFF